jgi:protein phosphatase
MGWSTDHMGKQMVVRAQGQTDPGRVRPTNQDSYLVDESGGLFIVADGMGGHAGGEIASRLCIQEIAGYIRRNAALVEPDPERKHPDQKIQKMLAEAVNHASARIYDRALEDPALKGMGTTATLFKTVDDYGYVAHVGDSRLYLVRCGFNYQITLDHSLVSEQVRAGLLTKEEAELHHLRNVITRSVGYQEEEYVDTCAIRLEDHDKILICSDGLHGKISDQEIVRMVKGDTASALGRMIDEANARGGEDNISAVLVSIQVS